MQPLGYFMLVGAAVLLAVDSYPVERRASGGASVNKEQHGASLVNDESAELAAKQSSAEDDVVILDVGEKVSVRRNAHSHTDSSTLLPSQPKFDDYSSESDVPFVDLDAIQPAISDFYHRPVTGMFKPAKSNDWFHVEQHMHDYYFREMGHEMGKGHSWQPVKDDMDGLNFESLAKSYANN